MADEIEASGAAEGESPGRRLRQRRESLGWSLEQAAHELRMSASVLAALEEERWDVLEAPIFIRGHLRNYARLLGLPPEELVAAWERVRPVETPEIRPGRPQGPHMAAGTPRWVFVVGWMVLGLMLVMGVLWWYAGPHRDPVVTANDFPDEADATAEVSPEEPLEPDLEPEDDDDVEIRAQRDPDVEMMPEALEAPMFEAEAPEEETEAAELEEGIEPIAVGPGEPIGPDFMESPPLAEPVRVRLRFEEDSWIELDDGEGRQVYQGLAASGEDLELDIIPPIQVFLGNGPAVRVDVDGESVDFSERIRGDNTVRFDIPVPETGE